MENKVGKVKDIIGNKFLEERKIFLWGNVDDDSAREVVNQLLYLDMVGDEDIEFFINSPGGYVTAGFSIYDTMLSLRSDVSTICSGLAASMGSILLSGGTKGKRFIQPHGKVMIHQPSGGARGQAANIEIQAQEIVKTKELSAKILAENCGQTVDKILKDFNRDYWMDAQESIEYGIVDGVYQKRK
ncbi:MAG TPA: ATP-dependent Clp protease proteolytic subunit [Flavobacteriaceae bacterium]|nr:ATP-dependent Clp protease proteolytic subunit [Flavobacteriaceae bacterium]